MRLEFLEIGTTTLVFFFIRQLGSPELKSRTAVAEKIVAFTKLYET